MRRLPKFVQEIGETLNPCTMERTSFRSKIYRAVIRLKGIKQSIEKEFQSGDFSGNDQAAPIPEKIKSQYDIIHRKSPTGRSVWELRRKNTDPERFILYLHGGAFVH